jgi:hypothetical protein
MNYTLTKILSSDTIGNNLSALNLNYQKLEYRTNNIINSSIQIFEPLIEYYNFYNNFWKNTIDYSYAINAPERFQKFKTTVQTNSSLWISPISIFYPTISEYKTLTFSNEINKAINWFKNNFPIFTSTNSTIPLYPEGTKAFLNCMFYTESVKVNANNTVTENVNCSTFDRSASVNCIYNYLKNVFCGSTEVCSRYNGSRVATVYTLKCTYENGNRTFSHITPAEKRIAAQRNNFPARSTITRQGIAQINSYFKDRSEYDNLFCILLEVKNCEWRYIKTI